MRKIGYIRVGSASQNPARQVEQLNKVGMDLVYEEKVSGATKDHPMYCCSDIPVMRGLKPYIMASAMKER